MQQKYLEHYLAQAMHDWFMNLCKEVGDTPIRAAIQNHLYIQDPKDPSKVRLQTFISEFIKLYEDLKTREDPNHAPKVYEGGVSIFVRDVIKQLEEKEKSAQLKDST